MFFLLHSLTKFFHSPCCGQPSIRSSSSNINCRVQWSRESYNQMNSFTLKANQTKTNSSLEGKPCGTRNKVMKTRGLTTYPKQLTNPCSPCCDHLSIRSSSFIIDCRVQWSRGLTIKPTAYLNVDLVRYLNSVTLYQSMWMWHENIKGKHQQYEGEVHNDVIAEILLSSIHTQTFCFAG